MSNADRVRVSVVAESSFGVTGSDPDWLVLGITGQSIRDQVGYQTSRQINNDRNVEDLIRNSKSAGGGLPLELAYSPSGEGLMRLLLAVMCGTETAAISPIAANTTTAATRNLVNGLGNNWTAVGVQNGDIVKLSGGAVADMGYYRVLSGATTPTCVLDATANFSGSPANVTVSRGARITNGVVETTFSIEVARLDLQIATVFTGMAVDSVAFTIADQAITTANLTFQGSNSVRYTTPLAENAFGPPGDAPQYLAATVSPKLDSIAVPVIRSQSADYAAQSVAMTIANNIAPRTQVGSLGPQSLRWGQFSATGTIGAYLDDFADLAAYADNTATDLWLAMIDANSKGYTLSFPQIKFSSAAADTSGPNTDDLVQLSATAYKDPTELITARLQRWD